MKGRPEEGPLPTHPRNVGGTNVKEARQHSAVFLQSGLRTDTGVLA